MIFFEYMRTFGSSLLLLVGCLSLCSCGLDEAGKKLSTSSQSDASPALMVESAIAAVNTALNDVEQVSSYAQKDRPIDFFLTSAYAAACSLSRFSPSIGSANCDGTAHDTTVTSTLLGCSAGDYMLTGQIHLLFDSETTCDTWIAGAMPTAGYVSRTSSFLARRSADGSGVTISSGSHTNYAGVTIGGGVRTSFSPTGRTIDILGLKRTRTHSSGRTGFDHSIYSTSSLFVTGTRASGNRLVNSGAIRVDHNPLKFSTTISMSGLSWNAACCHPVGGTLNLSLTGAVKGEYRVSLNPATCGQVEVGNLTSGETASATLATCE